MLPDLSPAHILIVVVVALVVVGPKDLPMLLRKIGQFMGKMRGMANEFRASFDEMARQSELDELRKEVEAMRLAANAATPDLGVTDALKDAEGAYMSQWQDSMAGTGAHAAPDAIVAPPPPPEVAPAPLEPPAQPDAPPKIRKPRAKKPKPEAETGA
jgi:sec-independent protein translocase protein TatB